MSKTSTSRLNELMTIRDILMGEIIEEYNDRFIVLENALNDQKKSFEEKERQLDERIKALDVLLQNETTGLHEKIAENVSSSRKSLGALFLSLGQELREEK